MSEPLSSTEIEDVLSSIRRLVSEDLRPLQRPVLAAAAPDVPAQVVTDKLILTPAFRVVQDEMPGVADVARPVLHRLHLGLPEKGEGADLNQIVASVGAAVDAQETEWEAETGDLAPLAAVHPAPNDWHDDEDGAPFVDMTVAISDEAGEPDGVDIITSAAIGDDPFAPVEDSIIPGWAQLDPETAADLSSQGVDAPVFASGTLEPDSAWADAAEASVIAALAGQSLDDEDSFQSNADGFGDEPMLFDEAVLRELVRDILREELAGRMGERITRNIRKLVRAEIARSFATQEFE